MGVHYFYTWITRRYPLIRKRYESQLMPLIDNFYIDLNGVLYRCAKDQGAIFRDILNGKGFDEIFRAVVNYINYVVNHVKPKKRLFIAIDGVAPRAKMNNQRQRRYHSAKTNKDMNQFLTNTLETSPGIISFQNNSISPGTEFMMTLIEHLKFFIQRKIKEDENWQKVEIILSGGDVPGEGEHKIMDWIRGWKQGPDYSINETHCVYGNDSDLVFLCLSLHIPNMVILREEMVWDRRKVNTATKREPSSGHMELLFINILREYMLLEYREIEGEFQHEFDIERIIDDFTLLSFFIGNDFLHKLYCMNTKKGNFDEIIHRFKKTLAKLDGYVSEKGKVNWKRFLQILKSVSYMENKMMNTTLGDMEQFLEDLQKSSYSYVIADDEQQDLDEEEIEEIEEHKAALDKEEEEKAEDGENEVAGEIEDKVEELQEDETPQLEFVEQDDQEEMKQLMQETIEKDYGGEKKSVLEKNHELEYKTHYSKIKNEVKYISELLSALKNGNDMEIMTHKAKFYQKFFQVKDISKLKEICREYLKGIQFVMYYYFRGCPSWEWFYPFFMSPMLSDLVVILESLLDENINLEFTFEDSEPYKPFNQLMFILPKASLSLLPPAYEEFIFKENSNITRFYPEEYDFDPFDGIKDYLWIAKIEVINKEMIDEHMKDFDYDSLSDEEKCRNRRGNDIRYLYDPEAESSISVKSTLKGIPDFEVKVKIEEFDIREQYEFKWENISLSQKDLRPNSFPTLFLIENIKVRMQKNSRKAKYDKVIIEIRQDEKLTSKKAYKPHGGKVYYDYPFRLEGQINSVIAKESSRTIGSLDSKKLNSLIRELQGDKGSKKIYYAVSDDVSKYNFFQKGIDLKFKGEMEYYYEIERPKSSWRSACRSKSGHFDQIIHEFEHVPELHPHTLIFKEKNGRNLINVCNSEKNMLKTTNCTAVELLNGNLLTPLSFKLSNGEFHVKKNNYIGSNPPMQSIELMEDDWNIVDAEFLADIGLKKDHATILWFIIDSFVIRTDSSQTSSLVLGEFFDIGLNFMDCLSRFRNTRDFRVVTDMIKIFRVNSHYEFSLPIRERNTYLPHTVYLTTQAKEMLKEYVKTFPEVIKYIKSNLRKFNNPQKFPKDHDVKHIFKTRKNEDPNIKLFNIYSWIMKNPTNTLKLRSALCLNASSDKIKQLSETIDKKIEKYNQKQQKKPQTMKIDKNLVIYNNEDQLCVGSTFIQHPTYPNIGDRVVITTNQHPHLRFGLSGTVIGTYKLEIEILFDEPFIGGTDLSGRCPPFRGAIVDFFNIFNITNWSQYINKRSKIENGKANSYPEWEGRVDMMLLISKMNSYRKEYEKNSFIPRKKSGNSFRKMSGNSHRKSSENSSRFRKKKEGQPHKLKKSSAAFSKEETHQPHHLKKTSAAFSKEEIHQPHHLKKSSAAFSKEEYQPQRVNAANLEHNLMSDLGLIGNYSGIPLNQLPQQQIGNYQNQEEDFQQTFYVTDNGQIPHHKRQRNQKKRFGDHTNYRKKNNGNRKE